MPHIPPYRPDPLPAPDVKIFRVTINALGQMKCIEFYARDYNDASQIAAGIMKRECQHKVEMVDETDSCS